MGPRKALLPQSKVHGVHAYGPENLTPVLNEDARSCWLGRDNVGYATIEGK